MSKCSFFFYACFLLLIFSGCKKEVSPMIEIPQESQDIFNFGIKFESGSGYKSFSFSATSDWTSEISGADAEASSWLTVSPSSGGAGDVRMMVSAGINSNGTSRSAVLTLRCGTSYKAIYVTQEANPLAPKPVKAITLDATSITLEVGTSVTLTATVEPSDADYSGVQWSTSNKEVARVDNGTVVALSVGNTTITARAGDKYANCFVDVKKSTSKVESITIDRDEIDLVIGESTTLVATIVPADATGTNILWTSFSPDIASVDDGTVTGLSEGVAFVQAMAGDKKATCRVNVLPDAANILQIEDECFFNWLIVRFDKNGDGSISTAEANEIWEIKIDGNDGEIGNLKTLKGIELMPRLGWLQISNCPGLEYLDLSSNAALYYLSVHNCGLSSLDASNCTSIEAVRCSNNKLISLDLSDCTNIINLICNDNQISNLILPASEKLDLIECHKNQITELDVSGCIALKYLKCDYNQIASIVFHPLAPLETLRCAHNQLTRLNITSLSSLKSVDCSSNLLSNIVLPNTQTLKGLACDDNPLTELDLSAYTSLVSISCMNCNLSSLDVSSNTNLQSLHCSDNQISKLDLSRNDALTLLFCNRNTLSHLNVSNNSLLSILICSENSLPTLDLSSNSMLTELGCGINPITNLDLSSNTELSVLSCANTKIEHLDLSKNLKLESLNCSYTPLSSINLSANTKLISLLCNQTKLSSLDISANKALQSLYCTHNRFSSLDVSYNLSLSTLDCRSCVNLTEIWLRTGQYIENFRFDASTATVKYRD